MTSLKQYPITHWNHSSTQTTSSHLIGEEPLSIRIQGKPYSVVMRTPGDEIAHVAGFCLAEGIIDEPDDVVSIACCEGTETNVVTVTLKQTRRDIVSQHLERRGYISQTSCGLCGKEMVEELHQIIAPIPERERINIAKALHCLNSLPDHQPLREKTRASHAAALFDKDYNLLSVAEDVGRHNALDKAIGKLFLDQKLHQVSFLVLSSRISYELVQKAARARIPIIFAISRPTALAVELASKLHMTLACLAGKSGVYIFCEEQRLTADDTN